MTLQIYPFSASESKIDGLRIINVKMVTDDRGTVRELYRESSHSEVLPETLSSWKQINLTRTKRGAVCMEKPWQSWLQWQPVPYLVCMWIQDRTVKHLVQ